VSRSEAGTCSNVDMRARYIRIFCHFHHQRQEGWERDTGCIIGWARWGSLTPQRVSHQELDLASWSITLFFATLLHFTLCTLSCINFTHGAAAALTRQSHQRRGFVVAFSFVSFFNLVFKFPILYRASG
jgi:hypothetical protein